ncbi:MAG: hypothetical protein ACRBBK_13630 [Paracoccaceae bacterium]
MRAIFTLPALIVLAACASPQQRCLSNVSKDQRVIEGLIAETELNISRGYAIEKTQTISTSLEICGGFGGARSELVFCQVATPTTREKPIAIDPKAEASKLSSLRKKHTELARASAAAKAQCVQLYPEG